MELCRAIPLRPFRNDIEMEAATDLAEILRGLLIRNEISQDELDYLEVLELLIEDHSDTYDVDSELDPEDDHSGETTYVNDSDDVVEEVEDLLQEKHQKLQEWDYVDLLHNLITVISGKLAELDGRS